MAIYYVDTSALAKLYVRESGTERMLQLASRSAQNQLAVLALAQVEIRSTLRRRARAGEIDNSVAEHVLEIFQNHLQSRFLRQVMNEAILDFASALVDKHNLYTLDALQLAGYWVLKTSTGGIETVFVSADRDLLRAAEAEGIPNLDPCA